MLLENLYIYMKYRYNLKYKHKKIAHAKHVRH
jgi:hypothetical protein